MRESPNAPADCDTPKTKVKFKGLRVRMEEHPELVADLLEGICEGREKYADLARRLFTGVLTDDDVDGSVRRVVCEIAQKYLTKEEREKHQAQVRNSFTTETSRAAISVNLQKGVRRFTPADCEKSVLARGGRPWSDAEDLVIVALARKFKEPGRNGLSTNWQKVADHMNLVFQTDQFTRQQCSAHGRSIFKRHRKGAYGREMPQTNLEALESVIAILQPPQNGVDAITARTITEIQILLMQEENPKHTSLFRLIEEVHLFIRTIDPANITDRTKERAKDYRSKLLAADGVVEASGEEDLYGKLTMIIDYKKGQVAKLINPSTSVNGSSHGRVPLSPTTDAAGQTS